MRRDLARGDRAHAAIAQERGDLALAVVRKRVGKRDDDGIATRAGEAFGCAHACGGVSCAFDRTIRKRPFGQRGDRVRRAARPLRHAGEEILARLVADLDDARQPLRHQHADARAAALEQRVGAARGREAKLHGRKPLAELRLGEDVESKPRRVDRAWLLDKAKRAACGERNGVRKLDRVGVVTDHARGGVARESPAGEKSARERKSAGWCELHARVVAGRHGREKRAVRWNLDASDRAIGRAADEVGKGAPCVKRDEPTRRGCVVGARRQDRFRGRGHGRLF